MRKPKLFVIRGDKRRGQQGRTRTVPMVWPRPREVTRPVSALPGDRSVISLLDGWVRVLERRAESIK
jgi:hypothetical protein